MNENRSKHGLKIVGNWKSHKKLADLEPWLESFQKTIISPVEKVEVVLALPLQLVYPFWSVLDNFPIAKASLKLGVQDVSPFPFGSYTGAVAAESLVDAGISTVLVGHSERRRYFHETHQDVAGKVTQVVEAGMTPVVCVDEEYVQAQANAIDQDLLEKCVVAYEPLEAIGTGDNQPVSEALLVVDQIKDVFGDVPVIYGGSVDMSCIHEYVPTLDGVLPGGASLDPVEFGSLVTAVEVM